MTPLPEETPPFPPQKLWKKTYQCKGTKGEHEFTLVLPHYADWYAKQEGLQSWISARAWYDYDESKLSRGEKGSVLYFFACVHCGKKERETTVKKNRRIKVQV